MEFAGELVSSSASAGAAGATAIYSLWRSIRSIAVDLKNDRMKVHAVDYQSAQRIRDIVLGLVLISTGIAVLDAIYGDNVPSWAILFPVVAGYLAIAHLLDQVAWRDKMTVERFGEMVVSPVLAAFTPLVTAAISRAPSIVQSIL